jgi:NAD(P)-dependent dehydrogenase (short-subunit alcohol dehydrogenase family)
MWQVMSNLSGKVAIMTGSSRGIGSIIAQDLAKAGCSLIVNYSGSEAAAKAVVDQITTLGGQAIASKPGPSGKILGICTIRMRRLEATKCQGMDANRVERL